MKFGLKTLSLAIGLNTGFIALPSYAFPIEIDIVATTDFQINEFSDSYFAQSTEYAGIYSQMYPSELPGFGSSAVAWGNEHGSSQVSTDSSRYQATSAVNFVTSGVLKQSATVTNNTDSSQLFNFNFLVHAGGIEAFGHLTNDDFLNSQYQATISVNNVVLWQSSAQVYSDANNTWKDLSNSAFTSAYESETYYSWNVFNGSLNLGIIGAGESFTLEYQITSMVSGSLSECAWRDGASNYGYGDCIARASTHFGDPYNFSPLFDDNSITAQPVADVPEPAGILLLGAGLAGLAYRRRTKKMRTR